MWSTEGIVAFIALIGIGLYSGIKFCIKGVTGIFEDHQTRKGLKIFQKERKQRKKEGVSYTPPTPIVPFRKEKRDPLRLFFDENGNAWLIWEFLLRTLIIFSVVFFTVAFLHLYMNPDFDLNDKYFLIYAGGISIYLGFMGTEWSWDLFTWGTIIKKIQ